MCNAGIGEAHKKDKRTTCDAEVHGRGSSTHGWWVGGAAEREGDEGVAGIDITSIGALEDAVVLGGWIAVEREWVGKDKSVKYTTCI
jgi:hypothetical protein